MKNVTAFGTKHSFSALALMTVDRRDLQPMDVDIRILYCGVCHSDVHQAENDWKNTIYPCVPGHEIIGRVSAIGSDVSKVSVGEIVGVGCMVDSCKQCTACEQGLEQYCEGPVGPTLTYNGPMKPDGTNTFGGYSSSIVVPEGFVLRVPANLDPIAVAPILCAGVTTYSPLKHWQVSPGQSVGIVGLGGLGHMAVKIAVAMGAVVTVFSRSPDKERDAKRFGATSFVLSTDQDVMKSRAGMFDLVLNTIPEPHDLNPYVLLLKRDATLVVVGVLTAFAKPTDNSQVAFHRRSIAGSLIGSIAETQEVLDFCGQHNLAADVEVIAMADINTGFKRIKRCEVRYRQVIDIAGTLTI